MKLGRSRRGRNTAGRERRASDGCSGLGMGGEGRGGVRRRRVELLLDLLCEPRLMLALPPLRCSLLLCLVPESCKDSRRDFAHNVVSSLLTS